MIKYVDYLIGFLEVPDEVSLCINISGCPYNCDGCHSSYLREDIGKDLTWINLHKLISDHKGVSCVCLLGGSQDKLYMESLFYQIKHDFPELKTCWYQGDDEVDSITKDTLKYLDYIKIGHYNKDLGPLNVPTTNQKMYKYDPTYSEYTIEKSWKDITNEMLKK